MHKNKSFRPPFFKRRRFPKAEPWSQSADCEISYTHKRSGGEPKQSGELFWRGEPYQGVPRKKFDFVQSDNSGILFRQTGTLRAFGGFLLYKTSREVTFSGCFAHIVKSGNHIILYTYATSRRFLPPMLSSKYSSASVNPNRS